MLFFKKAMDLEAAEDFGDWFIKNENWIVEQLQGTEGNTSAVHQVVAAVDKRLTPVFPYEKNENIQFQLGANNGVNEFFFFHLGKKALKRDGAVLGNLMPASVSSRWRFYLER